MLESADPATRGIPARRDYESKKSNKKLNKVNQDKNKVDPKMTYSSNYMIWGRHAIISSIKNKNRNIIKIYSNIDTIEWVEKELLNVKRQNVPIIKVKKDFEELDITLKYHNDEPVIKELTRESKPGLRKYISYKDIKLLRH